MKSLKSIIALILIISGFVVQASVPILREVPVDHVYSPKGFDSNDNSEIVIEGYLPNLCHKSPQAKVVIKDKVIDIKVKSLYYHESNPFCPEMIVPFMKVVDLGVLDKGDYKILVNGSSPFEIKDELFINESVSDSVDEFVYANVEYIEKNYNNRIIHLRGYNPSDCFVLDKIEVVDDGKDVYSILPKMKQISDFCPMKMQSFDYEMEVPRHLMSDKVLLHVRGMDGKSVNSIFHNKIYE